MKSDLDRLRRARSSLTTFRGHVCHSNETYKTIQSEMIKQDEKSETAARNKYLMIASVEI
jgi:hypothetical protein